MIAGGCCVIYQHGSPSRAIQRLTTITQLISSTRAAPDADFGDSMITIYAINRSYTDLQLTNVLHRPTRVRRCL